MREGNRLGVSGGATCTAPSAGHGESSWPARDCVFSYRRPVAGVPRVWASHTQGSLGIAGAYHARRCMPPVGERRQPIMGVACRMDNVA